ncbi:hypothetical protein AB3480_00665 [Rhizobium mongolense]|uniref:hypothetical protein n=1 Tax=Rhizobium mongolense TaxID=57676 RepID=UPI0034A52224
MKETKWMGTVYDPDVPMSDGGDTRMTAAEEVLAYLLIEVSGAPDDVPYSPNQAQLILETKLKEGQKLEAAYAEHLSKRRESRSSAPDLLEALKSAAAVIGDWSRANGMTSLSLYHPLMVAQRAMYAAIAKAEGRS